MCCVLFFDVYCVYKCSRMVCLHISCYDDILHIHEITDIVVCIQHILLSFSLILYSHIIILYLSHAYAYCIYVDEARFHGGARFFRRVCGRRRQG